MIGSVHVCIALAGCQARTDSMVYLQAADFLFGSAALPHDFLHEPLLRILALAFAGASTAAASLNVSHASSSPSGCPASTGIPRGSSLGWLSATF